ncbi:MAG: oligosaccharide flippase family protein [Cyanobacteria bacterium J06650_10]
MDNDVSLSPKTKFGQGVIWTLLSFGVLSLSGILLNVGVGRFFGADALGIFNQVLAVYIFVSQLSVAGIHFSVLRKVSMGSSDPVRQNLDITAGLLAVALIALGVTLAGFLMADFVAAFFDSAEVSQGWLIVVPAIWFFSVNKVMLNMVNAFRRMKAFSVLQSLRYLLFLGGLAIAIPLRLSDAQLPAIVVGAEVILFVVSGLYCLTLFRPCLSSQTLSLMKGHVSFGMRSMLGGTLAELNTRIDILMLGFFASDTSVGIYSLASLLAEGVAQLPLVLRSNVNPIIAQLTSEASRSQLKQMVGRVLKISYFSMIVVGILSVCIFPVFVHLFMDNDEFVRSWLPFAILIVGVVAASGYIPFDMFLVQVGRPGYQTVFKASVVLSNVVFNAVLIPLYGLVGAAIATASAYVLSVFFLKYLSKKAIGITL